MLLNKQIIEIFKQLLNLSIETCGLLKLTDKGEPIIEIHLSKFNDKNRCVHTYYKEHIFHTHIHKNESFPSAHDVVKVMKNTTIQSSLIATHWGIWEITCRKKYNFSPDEQNHITKRIEKMLSPLHEYKNYNQHVQKYIDDIQTKYNEFELCISLHTWNQLKK